MRLNQEKIQRMFDGRGGVAGGGSSLDPGMIAGLATEAWTEENYVSKTFFNELFVIHKKTTTTVYDGTTVVSTTVDTSGTFAPNEIPSEDESTDTETGYRTVVVTEVDNIEAKKGLWTDFFLSALGLNAGGGGGGIGDVTWQALADNTDTRQIASSHLTTALSTALTGYATQSWVTAQNYVTSSAISDMATKTWVNNQSFVNWTALGDSTTTQQIALSHLTTALSTYATQTWVTNNFSTPSTVATQLQTYAKIQNGTITIGDNSLTPITSVTGTFWGKSFTNGGTVNGTIKAGSNGGAIEQFGSIELNSAGSLIAQGVGGFIDFHYSVSGTTFDSTLDYTSRIIESAVGVISIMAKDNNATNANRLAGLLVGDGYDGSYVQIGSIRIVYDSTNNALKVVKLVSGSEVAANFYATGSVSALGYGSGGGGGTGDVTWTNLRDDSDERPIALSHLTGALAGYATTSQLAGYVTITGNETISGLKTLTHGLVVQGRIYNSGDDEGILIKTASNNMAGITLGIGNLDAHCTLYFQGTSVENYTSFWRFRTGSPLANYDIYHPKKGGVIALVSDIPSLSNYVTLDSTQTVSGRKTLTHGLIVQGRVYGSGDDEGIIINPAANGLVALILGTSDGLRSCFYLNITSGESLWKYATTTNSYRIYHPKKDGIIAVVSDIPTDNSQLANGAGYITSSGTSAYAQSLKYRSRAASTSDIDSMHYAMELNAFTFNGFNIPILAGNGIIIDVGWENTNFGAQFVIDDDPTYIFGLRQRSVNGWSDWKRIPMGDGTGASGTWGISISGNAATATSATTATNLANNPSLQAGTTNTNAVTVTAGGKTSSEFTIPYATSAGNADTLDGYHASYGSDTPWGTIPVIHASGYMDIGIQLEFHYDNTTGSDFSTRLYCSGNNSNSVALPTASGTLALTSQFADYLPLTGGTITGTLGVTGSITATGGIVGNASSATKLATARTIWSQSFDGTGNVSGALLGAGGYIDLQNDNEINRYGGNLYIQHRGNEDGTTGQGTGGTVTGNVFMCGHGGQVAIGINTINTNHRLIVNGAVRADWFASTVATGTAPFSVSSTTTVTNLTAEFATKLATPRTIWNQSFDGSADVTGSIYLPENTPHYFRAPTNPSWRGGVFWGTQGNECMAFVAKDSRTSFMFANNSDIASWDKSTYTTITSPLLYIGTNVGVGTNSPSYKLHVAGTFYASGAATLGSTLSVTGDTTFGSNVSNTTTVYHKMVVGAANYTNSPYVQIGKIRFVYNDTDNAIRVVREDGTAANLYATGGISALGYQSGGGGGGSTGVFSTSITPDTTGTYDLGTTTYKWRNLYLAGANGGNGFSIITSYSSYVYIGSLNKILFGADVEFEDTAYVENRMGIGVKNGNYDLYVYGENEGNAYFAGDVSVASLTNRSDMRLKDVVGDVNLSVQQIASAPTFKFRFKEKAKRTMVGTSAQYWDAVLPESVTRDADGILGLDYGVTALVSTIILAKGMTEHERRITKLEKENAELRARIKDLEEN